MATSQQQPQRHYSCLSAAPGIQCCIILYSADHLSNHKVWNVLYIYFCEESFLLSLISRFFKTHCPVHYRDNELILTKHFGVLRWKYKISCVCFGNNLGISYMVAYCVTASDASQTTSSIQIFLKAQFFSPSDLHIDPLLPSPILFWWRKSK